MEDNKKIQTNDLYKIIKREVDKFDAYGLLEVGCPKNEFDMESKMIFKKLKKGMTKEQISIVMAETFSEMFGDEFKAERFDKHAEEIEKELNKI